MFPMVRAALILIAMNLQLTEAQIRSTCRELLAARGNVSGRALCAELKARYGAIGKTERVFAIWRQEVARLRQPAETAELVRRLEAAERAAAENLARAELAELREQAHQDKWAIEIDRLRQEVSALKGPDTGRKVFPV